MKLQAIYLAKASEELEQAVEFYESQRPGTGLRLGAEVR